MHSKQLLFSTIFAFLRLSSTTAWISQQRRDSSFLTLLSETVDPIHHNSATAQTTSIIDYDIPQDAVVTIKPAAMKRLRELRLTQLQDPAKDELILRMGVRSGGCSGMSYVMDFCAAESIVQDDVVDEYSTEKVKCVVDSKSMLYLYGLELDYSNELIGGGFKFFNPNAEESCGCGSSFGV